MRLDRSLETLRAEARVAVREAMSEMLRQATLNPNCAKCGAEVSVDRGSKLLTSPMQYRTSCACGAAGSVFCHDVDKSLESRLRSVIDQTILSETATVDYETKWRELVGLLPRCYCGKLATTELNEMDDHGWNCDEHHCSLGDPVDWIEHVREFERTEATPSPDGSTLQTTGCTGDQNQAGGGEKDE